jgi:hypothetical protein
MYKQFASSSSSPTKIVYRVIFIGLMSSIFLTLITFWMYPHHASGKPPSSSSPPEKWKQENKGSAGMVADQSDTSVNIMFSGENTIGVYTQIGVWEPSVQTVPYGDGPRPATESVRDIVMDEDNGLVYIYNGTFDPFLTIYNRSLGTWTHETTSGWSTVNNVSYGGIARYQSYIYLSDMSTAYDGSPAGIVRFDTTTSSFMRFADGFQIIDLTVGFSGKLYALDSNESTVRVYDPSTNDLLDTITLAKDVRGIAVNESGEIFGASWDDNIYHFDNNGALIKSTASGTLDLTDIDINRDGLLAVGSRFGDVILTDETLANLRVFSVDGSFVAFTSLPFSIEKSVTPLADVAYNDEITYTLVISGIPGTQAVLYDRLEGTVFRRFVSRPAGVIHFNNVIIGGLTITPTIQVSVSFVARVNVPVTMGQATTVTNRACIFPFGETLAHCFWSNEVTNSAFPPYSSYLPLIQRNH